MIPKMNNVLVRVFFAMYVVSRIGETSRFLPMIVWDHINPMLSCKCNWFNIPKMDVYDEVNMMCPTLKVTAKLLDGYTRPTEHMNENIFRRKWSGSNLNELKKQLSDGSFCDPSHKDTAKLFTCINGNEDASKLVKFTKSTNSNPGDVIVFFNNGDDGRAATLKSKAKYCSSVFIVNVTRNVKEFHDLSYGKCLSDQGKYCKDIDIKCGRACESMLSSYAPTVPENSTTPRRTTIMAKTEPPKDEISEPSTVSSKTQDYYHRNNSIGNDFSIEYLAIGLVAGIVLCGVIFAVFFLVIKMKGHKRRQNPPPPVLT